MANTKTAPADLPAWLDHDVWESFVEMRHAKGKRAPFTPKAQTMILAKLAALKAQGHDPNACLAESVMNGWSGVFGLRLERGQTLQPEQAWYETRKGIEAKGVELGLGPWDENAWSQGKGQHWPAYRAMVMRKADMK